MTPNRWTHALDQGAVGLLDGRVLVHGARAECDYSALGDVHLVSDQFPEIAALEARGGPVGTAPDATGYAAALVQIVKSKPRSLGMLAEAYAALAPGGVLLVDGQKTEGIESILKLARGPFDVVDVLSKSHGKLFWIAKTGIEPDLTDWFLAAQEVEGGYITRPGVFSSDGPDQGSELLIALVPELKGRVADFGSGWGYLAGEILQEQAAIASLDLVEADKMAHDCAVKNVTDPRARHVWGDVTTHTTETPYDAIICNPPFHSGRAADPDLGRAFIAAAARNLTAKGRFYMVANRHLPYEAALKAAFGTGRMLAEIHGYKLYEAAKPKGARRPGNRG